MFESLQEDWRIHERNLTRPGLWVMAVYRFGRWRRRRRSWMVGRLCAVVYWTGFLTVRAITGIELPDTVVVGRRFLIDHFGDIIVHGNVVFGDDVVIRNGVTIGVKHRGARGVPRIGHRVDIGAGAKILGPIEVGDDVKIGANAVVVADVPANSLALGVPAVVKPRRK